MHQTGSMQQFQTKVSPTLQKLRGGFYTPDEVAAFISSWVIAKSGKYLEPSCGDGALLRNLPNFSNLDITAIEINEKEAKVAFKSTGMKVITKDFFSWFTPKHYEEFDGVMGNPPYIRFGNWQEESRGLAIDILTSQGFRPNKLINAWMPFVVSALLATKQSGRIGLILPAELLQVSYAAELRSYLMDNSQNIKIVSFRELIFPGVQQEVILLLLTKGVGPAQVQTYEVQNGSELSDLDLSRSSSIRGELHDDEKWTKYYLDSSAIQIIRRIRKSKVLYPVGDFAEVQVGIVTGCNDFFCLSKSDAVSNGIYENTIPIVTRSNQLKGIGLDGPNFAALETTKARTRLLELNNYTFSDLTPPIQKYIREGERQELNLGYKCRIRGTWWKVPSIWIPDGFMWRQIHKYPRIFANCAGATSTDTVHRVRMISNISIDALAIASLNSATLIYSELFGRSYGGGVLELEPSEARSLLVPHPKLVTKSLSKRVKTLLEGNEVDKAVALVDKEILSKKLGFTEREIFVMHQSWITLSNRRLGRK